MPVDVEVNADDFLRVSKALKAAGRTELRKELHRALQRAAKPLVPKAKAAARSRLPQRGGLAAQVASEPVRAQVRTGRDPGVRIAVGKKRGGAQATNRGTIRHPVFGRPGSFVSQPVPAAKGWFDETMAAEAPSVRPDLDRAMEDVAEQIVRGVR